MTAKAIISRLFKQFLVISGLTIPFAYFCIYVLEPICDWFLDQDDPQAHHATQVKAVREVAKQKRLDCFAIILEEREQCSDCGLYKMVHVQPEDICIRCWGRNLGLAFEFNRPLSR